jgi:hypothetical protein
VRDPHQVAERHVGDRELHLPRLEAGVVQDAVDQPEQVALAELHETG